MGIRTRSFSVGTIIEEKELNINSLNNYFCYLLIDNNEELFTYLKVSIEKIYNKPFIEIKKEDLNGYFHHQNIYVYLDEIVIKTQYPENKQIKSQIKQRTMDNIIDQFLILKEKIYVKKIG